MDEAGYKLSTYINYFLLLVWTFGLGIYIYYLRKSELKKAKGKSKSHQSKRKRGKRCPQCKNIINAMRTVCQHCGYQFPALAKEEQEVSHHSGSGKKKQKGKKCPKCQNVINYYRTVCQHCGYQFPDISSDEKPEQKDVIN